VPQSKPQHQASPDLRLPGLLLRKLTSKSVETFFEKVFPFSAMQQAHEDSAFFHQINDLSSKEWQEKPEHTKLPLSQIVGKSVRN
jgi:hypothetical protein